MRSVYVPVLLAGCFQPPDLPPFLDEVPIVAQPFTPCAPEDEDVRVACVIDGDTVDLGACGDDVGERVRLLGIDAPETSEPAECFADEAKEFLLQLIEGETLTMSHDRTCTGAFGRTLGYLWLRDDAP